MSILSFPRATSLPPCFVRLRERRADGFVEFDFSMGDVDLCVELILPQAAFDEFCAVNQVQHITAEQGEQLDADQAKWRYGHPGITD
jgi:phenol hydroxylase P0 protein